MLRKLRLYDGLLLKWLIKISNIFVKGIKRSSDIFETFSSIFKIERTTLYISLFQKSDFPSKEYLFIYI